MRNGVPTQMGGHFFVPSLRCAFRLDAESTFLCWHSARHLHGTTLSSFFKKVFRLEFACIFFLLNHIPFQTRIGTSMQLTQKHVHAEFAALNKSNYHAADCPVRMDLLHA